MAGSWAGRVKWRAAGQGRQPPTSGTCAVVATAGRISLCSGMPAAPPCPSPPAPAAAAPSLLPLPLFAAPSPAAPAGQVRACVVMSGGRSHALAPNAPSKAGTSKPSTAQLLIPTQHSGRADARSWQPSAVRSSAPAPHPRILVGLGNKVDVVLQDLGVEARGLRAAGASCGVSQGGVCARHMSRSGGQSMVPHSSSV